MLRRSHFLEFTDIRIAATSVNDDWQSSIFIIQKRIYYYTQHYNFAFCFICEWNLVADTEEGM
jgi:hypothetical protein